jgi:hypothetical protein
MTKLKEKKIIFNKKISVQTNTWHFYRLMLRLFGSKIFSIKYFLYFLMFVQREIMVNGNHFQFNRKNLFNFWKTIYSFKNRKSCFRFKLFILSYMFVGTCHLGALEFVGSPNLQPKVFEFRYPITRFRPRQSPLESDQPWFWQIWPESCHHRQNPVKMAGILSGDGISSAVIFL